MKITERLIFSCHKELLHSTGQHFVVVMAVTISIYTIHLVLGALSTVFSLCQ